MASLFFSYSHKDEDLRDQLEVHLSMLKRGNFIDVWHDRKTLAGDEFDRSINSKLDSADIILLLLSPDFLASNYCYDIEVKRAIERHERGECRVIAVILRPCDWKNTPFAKLLLTPTDGKAVTKWPDRDDAFLDVVNKIREALPTPPPPARALPTAPVASAVSMPRSSNLRLRKEFTEVDRDRFLDEAFEFIASFFEGSLTELQQRNDAIETRFKRIDSRAFGVVIYQHGKAVARCGIRHGASRGFMGGIAFSHDENAPTNSFNESLSIGVGEQALFLKPMGMANMGAAVTRESQLTPEGAAEFL